MKSAVEANTSASPPGQQHRRDDDRHGARQKGDGADVTPGAHVRARYAA
jgi:hypothetical protein